MKRIAFFWLIVALASPVAAASAHSGGGRAGARSQAARGKRANGALPRSQLEALACHTATQQSGRSVSIRAVMRPVGGTQRMQMRFELLSRSSPGAAAVEVPGTRLGSWISPANPTLGQRPGDVWFVPDLVRNLPAPASYNYRVNFRWVGTGGRVLATQTRSSRDCYQPALLPDLLVRSIAIDPTKKATKDNYVATIENDGQAPAVGPFTVTFTPAAPPTSGAVPMNSSETIQRVDVGANNAVTVTFAGPACSATDAPTVVVDPEHAVNESDFGNNSLTVDPSCPALTSAPNS